MVLVVFNNNNYNRLQHLPAVHFWFSADTSLHSWEVCSGGLLRRSFVVWYVGGATWCFSESFAYQGVYCPSELSLFSRPPSWQLVRTPKVIRLHNTHTVPLRNLIQNTSARRSPLSRSVFRRIFFSFAQRFSSLCVTNLANSEIFAPLGSVPTVPVFTLTH